MERPVGIHYVLIPLAHKTRSIISKVGQKSDEEKATFGWVLCLEGKQDLRRCNHGGRFLRFVLFSGDNEGTVVNLHSCQRFLYSDKKSLVHY